MYDVSVGPSGRYVTVGSLAAALRSATSSMREVESDVDDFVESLFPGWRPLFPPGRGWTFVAPDTIHVYGVAIVASPATTTALHVAGFRRAVLHDHQRTDERCECAPRIDPSSLEATPARGSPQARTSSSRRRRPHRKRGG